MCLLSKHTLQYFCMVSVPFLWLVANFTGCLRGVCAPRVWLRPVNLSAAPHVSHRCLSISPLSHSSTSKLCSLQCYKPFFFIKPTQPYIIYYYTLYIYMIFCRFCRLPALLPDRHPPLRTSLMIFYSAAVP